MMRDNPEFVIWLGLAASTISFTIAKTPIFEWFRDLMPQRSMLQHLVECPYCIAHWVGFAFVAIFRPMPFTGMWVDLIIVAFAIPMIAIYFVQVMLVVGRFITWFGDQT